MKIIVGDAKTQKIPTAQKEPILETTIPEFDLAAQYLRARLKKLNRTQLERQFKVSPKIAATLHENYHSDQMAPAIILYQGIVFKEFNRELDQNALEYYDNHLRIVSPLYGLVRPRDNIAPYRLSMSDFAKIDLYAYHQPSNTLLQDEDFLILLCSQEFAKLIDHPQAYFIDFLEFDGPAIKRPSAHVKKARGMMVAALESNNVTSLDGLKSLAVVGFSFNPDLSNGLNLAFTRDFTTKKTKSR